VVFNHDFITNIDFTYIAAGNAATASDDVTNFVTHRILHADLLYSYDNFIVKTGEKNLALTTVFNKI